MAYGVVGHLISNVRVQPKRPTGAPAGTHQVAYGMVGDLISKSRLHLKLPMEEAGKAGREATGGHGRKYLPEA